MGVNDHLSLSEGGASLVKAFESCLQPVSKGAKTFKPYICPAGVPTIGWGHTNAHGRRFTMADRWSQEECDREFMSDMVIFEDAVRRLVRVPLEQHQFDALVSFAYNCGEGNLKKSTLLRKVNRNDFDGAAAEFAKWNKGGGRVLKGLVRRRASEALMFQGLSDLNYDGRPDGPMPQGADRPRKPSIFKSKIAQGSVGVGIMGGSEVLSSVNEAAEQVGTLKDNAEHLGLLDLLAQLAMRPSFWFGVAMILVAGAIFYWRMRDHN